MKNYNKTCHAGNRLWPEKLLKATNKLLQLIHVPSQIKKVRVKSKGLS